MSELAKEPDLKSGEALRVPSGFESQSLRFFIFGVLDEEFQSKEIWGIFN